MTEIKDWNDYWSKYASLKIDKEWLETNYPEVLKAWKEHRQPIILKKIYDEEQAKIREAGLVLRRIKEVEKFLDEHSAEELNVSEEMIKALRLTIELGKANEDKREHYWVALRTLGRSLKGWPIRRGHRSEEE